MQQQGDKEKDAEGRRKREKSAKKKAKKQTVVNDEEKQVGQTPNGRVLSGAGILTVGEVPPSPAVEEELELPEVTEEIVKTLSPEVYPFQLQRLIPDTERICPEIQKRRQQNIHSTKIHRSPRSIYKSNSMQRRPSILLQQSCMCIPPKTYP